MSMKPTSINKAKHSSIIFTYNNKQKENTKQTSVTSLLNCSNNIKKSNTFRQQGNLGNSVVKTTKNSRKSKVKLS